MKQFREFYTITFFLLTSIVFVFGGIIQFLFGVPNTVITFMVMCTTFLVYGLYSLMKGKISLNSITGAAILFASWIVISSLINSTELIKVLIYLIFPLLPLGIILFAYINYKEKIISNSRILKFFYAIGLLQLPVLLIQKNFFDDLIIYNNSGQLIDWYDFMFGTFFIKSDHSLGFFLLLIIIVVLLNKENIKKTLYFPRLSVIYLSITIFLTESNISKFFLLIILSLSILLPLYQKHKHNLKLKIGALIVVGILAMVGYSIKDEPFIEKRFGGSLSRQFSEEVALRQYELGNAKRYQILIVAVNELDLKMVGNGPYDYFDIITGKFKKTKHFSQIIWSYFDLGLVGLSLFLFYLYMIIRYLDIRKGWSQIIFFGVMVVYSFYNIIFADLAILISLIVIFNKKSHGPHYHSIS